MLFKKIAELFQIVFYYISFSPGIVFLMSYVKLMHLVRCGNQSPSTGVVWANKLVSWQAEGSRFTLVGNRPHGNQFTAARKTACSTDLPWRRRKGRPQYMPDCQYYIYDTIYDDDNPMSLLRSGGDRVQQIESRRWPAGRRRTDGRPASID